MKKKENILQKKMNAELAITFNETCRCNKSIHVNNAAWSWGGRVVQLFTREHKGRLKINRPSGPNKAGDHELHYQTLSREMEESKDHCLM